MTSRSSHKTRGATFEIDIRDYARALGYDAERLARAGSKDDRTWVHLKNPSLVKHGIVSK